MPSDVTYEIHPAAEKERLRRRERDLSHIRALKGDERTDGIWSRAIGGLGRLRPAVLGQPKLSYGAHVLTDKVCRLADGSLGRVAVRESDGEVIEVCVPA